MDDLKEPLTAKKPKNPFDLPSDDDEEEIIEDKHNNINMNAKVGKDTIVYVQPQNELLTNKTLKIKFLRNFLTVYISQIILIGLILCVTLNESAAEFIYNNTWLEWIGISIYIVLIIPVLLGLTRVTIPSLCLMIAIDISLTLILAQITVQLGNNANNIGYICFISFECNLVALYLYVWLIKDYYNP